MNSYVVIIGATLHEINLHMWSLCVPMYVKSRPKAKLGQVEVGSSITQNHLTD